MYCQEDYDVEHTLIEAMLEKVENWKLIVEYMRKIMTCKPKDERKEEEENAALR